MIRRGILATVTCIAMIAWHPAARAQDRSPHLPNEAECIERIVAENAAHGIPAEETTKIPGIANVVACTSGFDASRHALNDAYLKLSRRLSPVEVARLEKAQLAWLAWLSAECALQHGGEGSAEFLFKDIVCPATLNWKRASDFEAREFRLRSGDPPDHRPASSRPGRTRAISGPGTIKPNARPCLQALPVQSPLASPEWPRCIPTARGK